MIVGSSHFKDFLKFNNMEEAGKGSVRSLGLVVIGVVMLLVCGVAEAGNPCYAECVQNCLNNCGLNFEGCATCPVICGMRDTCKHEINSAKPEEALVIQSHTIKKNTVENVAGNPCYAECVQNCLNNCGLDFKGCATCPVICGMRDTCKHEINSAKPEEALVIQKDIIEKNTVGNVVGNPCYAECVQDCLNNCGFVGCAACPAICGTHDMCKHKINSGELEAAAMKQYCKVGCVSLVCAPMANILGLNSVADKQGSTERCNNGCSGFCTKHFSAAIGTE